MSERRYSLNSPYFRKKYLGEVKVVIKGEDIDYLGRYWWECLYKFEECHSLSLRLTASVTLSEGKVYAVQVVDPPCGMMEMVHESELVQIA